MENNNKKQSISIVMNGITINGPMFDIHDNKNVYISNSKMEPDTSEEEEENDIWQICPDAIFSRRLR